jgi:hypothetical protein
MGWCLDSSGPLNLEQRRKSRHADIDAMGHEPIFIVSVRCGASGCCGPDRGSLRSDAGGSTALVPCSQAIGAGCGSLLRERTVEPDRSNSYHLSAL